MEIGFGLPENLRRIFGSYLQILIEENNVPDFHELTEAAEMFEVPKLPWDVLIQLQGGKEEARQMVKDWIKAYQPFSGQINLRHLITMLVNYCQTDLESLLETIGLEPGNSANVEMLEFIFQSNPDVNQTDSHLESLAELLVRLGLDGQDEDNLTRLLVPTFLPPLPPWVCTPPISGEDECDFSYHDRGEYQIECEKVALSCQQLAVKLSQCMANVQKI